MMKKSAFVVAGLAVLLLISGCDVMKQVQQLGNLARCQFRLASMKDTELAGVNVQNKNQLDDFSFSELSRIGTAYAQGDLPIEFILDVDVKNPNSEVAAMNRMAWTLLVDDKETISGLVDQKVQIGANSMNTIPLNISFDLLDFFDSMGRDSLLNLVMNLAGQSSEPTSLTLKVKPSIEVAGTMINYPGYIDVNTEFGGGNSANQ
ncbi:hypothetical protein AB9P05_20175 [Roseivirga sp. BDSF3-8]|uniref:hypothetical protein n=1 Tax=Roseivirga sp. BDSF3-8 TaxID=3241598 RepID=UPI003531EFB0